GVSLHLAEIAQEMDEWQQRFHSGPAAALRQAGVLEGHVLGGNCGFLSDEEARILRGYDFHAPSCPQNCAKALEGLLDIPLLLRHGVNVALGTNDVSNNDNLDLLEEMRFAVLYHRLIGHAHEVFSGDTPLRLITANGGRALGLAVGTLAVGQK